MDAFKRQMREIKEQVERAADADEDSATTRDSSGINVAKRSNIVVARNIGGAGSAQKASGRQTTRIRQRDGKTVEQTVEEVSEKRADANGGKWPRRKEGLAHASQGSHSTDTGGAFRH